MSIDHSYVAMVPDRAAVSRPPLSRAPPARPRPLAPPSARDQRPPVGVGAAGSEQQVEPGVVQMDQRAVQRPGKVGVALAVAVVAVLVEASRRRYVRHFFTASNVFQGACAARSMDFTANIAAALMTE